MPRVLIVLMIVAAGQSPPVDTRLALDARVMKLTRDSPWRMVRSVPLAFNTYHPQGLVKIGEQLFVSSVDARERAGHLFRVSMAGTLLADLTLGEGAMYHPGGLDYDGVSIWVAVAEYRPDSRSIIYRIDPNTMKATEVFRVADHIGALVHNTDDHSLHGVSWGSRRFYRWELRSGGRAANGLARPEAVRMQNPSHYVDYQDCKYVGRSRMLCTGVTEIRQRIGASPFRLGGMDLVDLRDGRPLHQVPVLLWTADGLDLTHNPVWLEPTATGLRGYFIPEDNKSLLYVYEVNTEQR